MPIKQISAQELHTIITAGLPQGSAVVDVRTKEECDKGMIPGALHIPVDIIAQNAHQLLPYNKVYIYCLSGGRSQLASAHLAAAGFAGEILNLTSGLLAWRKEGYALV